MVSIAIRIYERKGKNKAHIVVGEGSRSGIECKRAIHSTCLLEGDIPAYRICKMLRFDLERVQRIFLVKGLPGIVRGSQRARRRQSAAYTATTPPVGKMGAFMADGRSGNFYQ